VKFLQCRGFPVPSSRAREVLCSPRRVELSRRVSFFRDRLSSSSRFLVVVVFLVIPTAFVVVKRVCCHELVPGAHSVSGPRFLQLGQVGHHSMLCSPKSLPSNRRSRSTRQSHLGLLSIFYTSWYNPVVKSGLQPVMAFVVLWSQPDPSVHSLLIHRVSACLCLQSSRRTHHPLLDPHLTSSLQTRSRRRSVRRQEIPSVR
jgi:Na+-transporting NADH:ubiquinone oxidoreductase subunit NqrB